MISKNTSCNRRLPFLLKPAGKDYLWGGTRLRRDFAKEIPMEPLAETWECSTHPDGPSMVGSGEFAGKSLPDVLKMHPEFLGSHPHTKDELPILIKLIDAHQDLSVQVHPDDAYAMEHENGSLGKSEMWYVLDAEPGAKLVYGFHRHINRELLQKSLENGTVEKYLQKVPIQKGDVFFVEAGTVHAIGAGALIAEIQQSSNLTYRLYDYHRVDKNGKPRELHMEKALEVVNLKSSAEPRQPMRLLRYRRGCAIELLCRCKYFQVERMLLNTVLTGEGVHVRTGENSFQVLLCIEGSGRLSWQDGLDVEKALHGASTIEFAKGDCIFIPAASEQLSLEGEAQLLLVSC